MDKLSMDNSHKRNVKSILLSVFLTITLALFILSVSIALPLLIRPIFYAQVESQNLPAQSGFSKEQIIEAYDDVMDYCTLGGEGAGRTFDTGVLAWTEEGKDHFDDVEVLFRLDFTVAIITTALLAIYLLVWLIQRRRNRVGKYSGSRYDSGHGSASGLSPARFLKRGPLFWGPAVLLALFVVLTIAAVVDFDGFFTWFHHLLFPGKENWLLNPDTDQIILILPYEVLQTFAIVIVGLILAGCVICMIVDHRQLRHTISHKSEESSVL